MKFRVFKDGTTSLANCVVDEYDKQVYMLVYNPITCRNAIHDFTKQGYTVRAVWGHDSAFENINGDTPSLEDIRADFLRIRLMGRDFT